MEHFLSLRVQSGLQELAQHQKKCSNSQQKASGFMLNEQKVSQLLLPCVGFMSGCILFFFAFCAPSQTWVARQDL